MIAEGDNILFNRLVLRNIISNYFGKFVNLVVWFLLTPFILSKLGQNAYGLWVLIASLVAYGSLFDLGIASAITKFVAEFHAKKEYQNAQGLVATALSLYTILGLLVLIISIAIAPNIPKLFNISPDQSSLSVNLMILSGLGIGLSIPLATFPAILRGLQRFDYLNIINIVGTLLYASGVVISLLITKNVLYLVIVSIIVNLLMQIPNIWFIHKTAPQMRLGWNGTSLKLIRKVASFSSYLFILNLNGYLETKTDEIVIGASLPVRFVTPYNIALRLSSLPQMLTSQFLSLILPMASSLDAQENHKKLKSLYLISTRITFVLFLPIAITITIFSSEILEFWLGTDYRVYAPLVIILIIASLIDTSTWPAGFILQGMARHQLLAVVSLVSGIMNLILSIILVKILGLMGVAIGTLIPTSLICLFFVFPYAMRLLNVNLNQIIKIICIPVLLPSIAMISVLLLFAKVVGNISISLFSVTSVFGILLFILTYLKVNPGLEESIIVVGWLSRTSNEIKIRINTKV